MRFEFKTRHFDFPPTDCVFFGILNVTPDSFSDGGRFDSPEAALRHAVRLQEDGADVIDVGGESTRPGAETISATRELERVLPVIRSLKKNLAIPISIDTRKAAVAEAALAEGAMIVNDISGLRADPRMAQVIAAAGAGLILMHSRGDPATMQTLCHYANVVEEVKCELLERCRFAVLQGIPAGRIALDPGVGFAKTREQNLELLQHLDEFAHLTIDPGLPEHPLMIGLSRKSFLGGDVGRRGPATLAAELRAWQQGARLIRTHDVAAIRQAIAAHRTPIA